MIHEKIYSRIYTFFLAIKGLKAGKIGIRYGFDIPRLPHKIKIGNRSNFDRGVSLILSKTDENHETDFLIEIGDQVYINKYTIIDATTSIKIGSNTMIGPHCYITDHDHDFKNKAIDSKIGELPISGKVTTIENNVWIGSGVTILKGVTIGENSIIGAGSVVTKSIPKNVVAVGNPCRIIKDRK